MTTSTWKNVYHRLLNGCCNNNSKGQTCIDIVNMFGLPLPLVLLARSPWSVPVMPSKVIPWYQKKHVSRIKTDYACHHSTCVVKQQQQQQQQRYGGSPATLKSTAALPGRATNMHSAAAEGQIWGSSCSCCISVCFLAGRPFVFWRQI